MRSLRDLLIYHLDDMDDVMEQASLALLAFWSFLPLTPPSFAICSLGCLRTRLLPHAQVSITCCSAAGEGARATGVRCRQEGVSGDCAAGGEGCAWRAHQQDGPQFCKALPHGVHLGACNASGTLFRAIIVRLKPPHASCPLWLRRLGPTLTLTFTSTLIPPPAPKAVRGKPMSGEEVDLLYRVFDTNKDGFLELSGAPSPLLPARWHKPRDG